MEAINVAVISGTISSEPRERTLPSGGRVVQLEVTTLVAGTRVSVPVVVHDRAVTVAAGDHVVVTGHVARRFFRAGGATQSRTELVADRVVRASRRRDVQRAVGAAVGRIDV